jgi:hypothetical protein
MMHWVICRQGQALIKQVATPGGHWRKCVFDFLIYSLNVRPIHSKPKDNRIQKMGSQIIGGPIAFIALRKFQIA